MGESEHQASKEMNRKRVLMASVIGTSITVKPGDTLRIGKALSCGLNDTFLQIKVPKGVIL